MYLVLTVNNQPKQKKSILNRSNRFDILQYFSPFFTLFINIRYVKHEVGGKDLINKTSHLITKNIYRIT